METFPVTSSILSADHINQFLKTRYPSANDTTCKLIKAGINHSYFFDSGLEKFVFRVYSLEWRTFAEISEEIRLLRHLAANGIPVSVPIADKNGTDIQQLPAPEGARWAVLFSFAAGEKLINYPDAVHCKIGEVMATIHQATRDFTLNRITYTPKELLIDPFSIVKQFHAPDKPEMQFMATAQRHLLAIFEQADLSKIRKGAVHMDIWFDNLNVNAQGEVALFDFDFCGNGWLCMDIAYYYMQVYFLEPEESIFFKKIGSFFEGYERVQPISDEEKRLLPMLGVALYFFYLGIQCRRFDNWSNVFINEAYLKRFIEMRVKKYYDFGILQHAGA